MRHDSKLSVLHFIFLLNSYPLYSVRKGNNVVFVGLIRKQDAE